MDKPKRIYSGKNVPLSVVVLFSGGASGAKYLFRKTKSTKSLYKIVAGITDNQEAQGVKVFTRRNLPVKVASKHKFLSDSGRKGRSKYGYFERLTRMAREFEPDLLLLSGFMQIVRNPLLSQYAGKIINVHPADLRIKANGKRKYRGDNAVYETIMAGEEELRSTVHFVTKKVDQGAIAVVSKPIPVEGKIVRTFQRFNPEMLKNYSNLLQEWMKWVCDGPSIDKSLSLIANGKVRYSSSKVTLKGPSGFVPGYYDLEQGKVVTTEA